MSNQQQLDDLIAEHNSELTPRRDLWRGVEAAIAHAEQRKADSKQVPVHRQPGAWAIAAGVVLAVTMITTNIWSPVNTEVPATAQLVDVLNTHQQQQREQLLVSYQQSSYEPSATAEAELTKLRDAGDALSKALQEDPQNQALLEMLRWVHEQELMLLQSELKSETRWQQL
ncbi:hypothetical protein SAMN06297229_2376 [Pseudidiomarina planktonica]|uniref:Uncharacterized protein n=1 Tax=Pseudidiomarina planktonica TaxID=1323738 RepID=A0A1Y6G027_9GAMM|nr:hypothetical protein [Pseudidiomarina planktonica]RUO62871.1 hypothetical protein CWI77_11805 [Pseudidiomarina planktonica]SMQ80756.1 hypothetical protein SAMN06297229_2376 [Pseudidiomarina planktonica]